MTVTMSKPKTKYDYHMEDAARARGRWADAQRQYAAAFVADKHEAAGRAAARMSDHLNDAINHERKARESLSGVCE